MPTSPHWTPVPPQPRDKPGYRKGMVLKFVLDVRDVRRQKLPAGTVVRLTRLLADHIWEAQASEFTTTILAESVLDTSAEVVASG